MDKIRRDHTILGWIAFARSLKPKLIANVTPCTRSRRAAVQVPFSCKRVHTDHTRVPTS